MNFSKNLMVHPMMCTPDGTGPETGYSYIFVVVRYVSWSEHMDVNITAYY
jgi:hypothetical protein